MIPFRVSLLGFGFSFVFVFVFEFDKPHLVFIWFFQPANQPAFPSYHSVVFILIAAHFSWNSCMRMCQGVWFNYKQIVCPIYIRTAIPRPQLPLFALKCLQFIIM